MRISLYRLVGTFTRTKGDKLQRVTKPACKAIATSILPIIQSSKNLEEVTETIYLNARGGHRYNELVEAHGPEVHGDLTATQDAFM